MSVWEDNHRTMYKMRVQSDSGVFELQERGHKLMGYDVITHIMYMNELSSRKKKGNSTNFTHEKCVYITHVGKKAV